VKKEPQIKSQKSLNEDDVPGDMSYVDKKRKE
jgi:hypothetical protein